MDYIYKNSREEKCVGTVEGLVITPIFDFSINVNGQMIWCQMERMMDEWCIHFIAIGKHVELAHPTDVGWNTNALYEVFEDIEISLKIAYAIKSVYKQII